MVKAGNSGLLFFWKDSLHASYRRATSLQIHRQLCAGFARTSQSAFQTLLSVRRRGVSTLLRPIEFLRDSSLRAFAYCDRKQLATVKASLRAEHFAGHDASVPASARSPQDCGAVILAMVEDRFRQANNRVARQQFT
jgi:hypothetical protein